VNVLSSMRHGSLFRLCVFPAEVDLCESHPNLCCTTKPIRTLCKKPRATPLQPGQQGHDHEVDDEEEELTERLQDQAKKISQLAQENDALLRELERLRAYAATSKSATVAQPTAVFKRESKRAR